MRKYIIFLLFLTTVSAIGGSSTYLNPDCSVTADKYGFVQLYADAFFLDPMMNAYCYDSNVTASINNVSYSLDRQIDCSFIKMLQLPAGTYSIAYNATYPVYDSLQQSCSLTVSSALTMNLAVYGVSNGDVYKPNSSIHIQAAASLGEYNVETNVLASLLQGNTTVKEMKLGNDMLGTAIGDMYLNVSEGGYTVRVSAIYNNFSVVKSFAISVNSTPSIVPTPALNLVVLDPESIVYPNNTRLNLQVEVQDEGSMIVSGASVLATVYKDGQLLETVALVPSSWYYQKSYLFDEVGQYTVKFSASKSYSYANASVSFFIGNESGLSEMANFTVKIMSPTSSVYLRDSSLLARAKVTEGTEPLTDASVDFLFKGATLHATYDKFGEYVYALEPLSEGAYDITAVASKNNLIAQSKVTFMISRHILNIDSITPYENQEFTLKKGDSLKIKAIVLNEDRDVVSGALVTAKILEPDGKPLQMQLFQDTATGEYSASLYLNELNGNYKVTIEASKVGFVPASGDSQFSITFQKETVQIFSQIVTVENLLYIILGVAIIILLAALLRGFL